MATKKWIPCDMKTFLESDGGFDGGDFDGNHLGIFSTRGESGCLASGIKLFLLVLVLFVVAIVLYKC